MRLRSYIKWIDPGSFFGVVAYHLGRLGSDTGERDTIQEQKDVALERLP